MTDAFPQVNSIWAFLLLSVLLTGACFWAPCYKTETLDLDRHTGLRLNVTHSAAVFCGCVSGTAGEPETGRGGTQWCICKLRGPRPWTAPAPARTRSDAPSVKHGCALEEGKMLNCAAKTRGKQQTWLDWPIISLWWDTTRKRPVSVAAGWGGGGQARLRSRGLRPGRGSVCAGVDARSLGA